MKIFSEILALPDVEGVVLFSKQGEILGWEFAPVLRSKMEQGTWQTVLDPDGVRRMIQSFEGMEEVELFFEEKKVLLRRAGTNHLIVVMGRNASTDMIRLVSDTLMPSLRKAVKAKKFSKLFRL